ncbi:DNA gyrase subunit A [Sansalvadorimonas sp. 2012CJ34-2]|uniref:DNA gyrase subunit A n=1 Tax=Parendozoicomonas callyspongiae TaxID=2942213 RepID=A0ABT0PIV2_9GAMM|nr:DNA gyrase subunit A [Sansalvadorimonas sp. 2012CJ34-2]MCL6271317.1 DNA gyrase subunit A [Sansalvadorimonas sp. 2012CJ34-2]
MVDTANEILPVNIEDELKQSYLDYAMSVIVGRALPDVRDGLKPVHRRVLFAMNELSNDWNKAYKKSARVVGDVIGKYHPHGDSAVYDTIVRMAQDFSLRYPLVDGQGNFGSIDGDSAAAMRYTEIRMDKLSHELLADLEKETVDFVPNYDGTEQIPAVLPTRIPNLLVNGGAGIAVGMATNIPPHNLTEVINGCLHVLDNPDSTIDELMEFIPGPDFPTAAIINGKAGILQAYRTGRGRIWIRSRAEVIQDPKKNREVIIIHELPYQVNKARLIEKIAELVKEKKIEGISEIRDESDKDGLRVVIELRRGEVGEVVLNNLYAQTQLETVFGINMVALVDGRPRTLNLKEMLEAFVRHRREVVTRRTVFELRKARERGHILEGLAVALTNIDPIIETIKKSQTSAEAKEALMSKSWDAGLVLGMLEKAGSDACRPDDLPSAFGLHGDQYTLSPVQAQAILEMRLHRLTGLEHEKLLAEYRELLDKIAELALILSDPERLMEVIREELRKVVEEYGDERRTEIISSRRDLTVEDLITEEDMVVTLSRTGYAKTVPVTEYQAQRRGGKGKSSGSLKEEDCVEHMIVANTHTMLLLFSTKGKVYWRKVYEIPVASRTARGRPIINILPLDEGEKITAMLPVQEYDAEKYLVFATAKGTVKKTSLQAYSRPLSSGIRAINLVEGDDLIGVAQCEPGREIMLFSDAGKVVRFTEDQARAMGRVSTGVRGIKLEGDQKVVSLIVPEGNDPILTATENGYGKRTDLEEYPIKGRATKGVVSIKVSERNGAVIGAVQTSEDDDIMLISDQGTLVRTRAAEVSMVGRNTQGVRLIRVADGEKLVTLERVREPEDEVAVEEIAADSEE